MPAYKVCTKSRPDIYKLLKPKSGSPAWIRTTINVIPLESVSYRFQKRRDCPGGQEIPTLAQYRLSNDFEYSHAVGHRSERLQNDCADKPTGPESAGVAGDSILDDWL